MLLQLPPRRLLRRRALLFAVHVGLIPLAYLAAFGLRFDFRIPAVEWPHFTRTLPYLIAIRALVFWGFGLYRGYWRHVGLRDLRDLAVAVSVSAALFVVTLYAVGGLRGMPRSVFALDWVLMIFLSGGVRFAARSLREGFGVSRPAGARTFIIGAGEAAEQLLRQALHDSRTTMTVVGLIDDNPDTHGRTLHGVPVLGGTDRLAPLVQRYDVRLLVIAIRTATAEQTRRIVERCRETGVEFKIIPSLDDLLARRATIAEVRDVQIEDLLGRDPVELDLAQVKRDLAGKSILVTGGAGSIGSELARQIASYEPKRLVLLERAESPLYFTHLEVAGRYPGVEVVPFIGSITNPERLEQVFELYRPDYVFHTAAYKHVPMLEANAVEAVWNNVFGTLRVAECAALHGVEKFVLISTDKAVSPSSMLGATKRIGERIVLELASLIESQTDFRAVRFGNVLGSDGSVVPVFKRQISMGGPVRVTHPDVRRYFMTIPEAVQLVLKAAALPEAARRIAILEMGRPVRIVDLAEQLIRLSGLVPYRDIQIVFTGLRPGEKLDEQLVGNDEGSVPTSVDKIRVIERAEVDPVGLERGLEHLLQVLADGAPRDLITAVSLLVPEYAPWEGHGVEPLVSVPPEPEQHAAASRATPPPPPPPVLRGPGRADSIAKPAPA